MNSIVLAQLRGGPVYKTRRIRASKRYKTERHTWTSWKRTVSIGCALWWSSFTWNATALDWCVWPRRRGCSPSFDGTAHNASPEHTDVYLLHMLAIGAFSFVPFGYGECGETFSGVATVTTTSILKYSFNNNQFCILYLCFICIT